jgi:hypothetical protein
LFARFTIKSSLPQPLQQIDSYFIDGPRGWRGAVTAIILISLTPLAYPVLR